MIGNVNNSNSGTGNIKPRNGETEFWAAADEIDRNLKQVDEEIENKKNRGYEHLDNSQKLLLELDVGLERFRRILESQKFKHLRKREFEAYVRGAYEINYTV